MRRAIELSRASLAIYLAGADPFEGDTLDRLALIRRGLARRDEVVLGHCALAGMAVAIVLAGGYARNIHDTVDIQFNTIRLAALSQTAQ